MKNGSFDQNRQGDVWIERISSIPSGATSVSFSGRLILAAGEVTGHHHAIAVKEGIQLEAYEKDGMLYLHIEGDTCELVHEEHGKINLPAGDYVSYIQGEYSPEGLRNVAD